MNQSATASDRDLPHTDEVVTVSSKQSLSICGSALALPGTSGRSSSTMFLLSKSQILIVGPVAAHSQYLLGLNVRALMVSAWSRVYRCLPSLRSQSMALASLPPEAQREPSGDIVTVFK